MITKTKTTIKANKEIGAFDFFTMCILYMVITLAIYLIELKYFEEYMLYFNTFMW